MADGRGPLLQLLGKVDSDNALALVITGNGLVLGPPTPIANLVGAVDDQGRLKVVVIP